MHSMAKKLTSGRGICGLTDNNPEVKITTAIAVCLVNLRQINKLLLLSTLFRDTSHFLQQTQEDDKFTVTSTYNTLKPLLLLTP